MEMSQDQDKNVVDVEDLVDTQMQASPDTEALDLERAGTVSGEMVEATASLVRDSFAAKPTDLTTNDRSSSVVLGDDGGAHYRNR